MPNASPIASVLADKLAAEGERVAEFFAAHADRQTVSIYADGAAWSLRQTLEHLILSERSLLAVFRDVAAGGSGAPVDTDVEAFNRAHTDELAALSYDALGEAFRAQRAVTVACARALTDEQLTLRGRHPAMGETPLGDMFKMIAMHGMMHLRDVRRALP
jgi:hypothetical protein